MQAGEVDERGRRAVLQSLASEGALHEVAEPREVDWQSAKSEFIQQKSAMFGFRIAMPLALLLWGLIAGLLWAVLR